MKKEDFSNEAIRALETLQRWNDEEKHMGPPAPETPFVKELVHYGLIERVTRPVVNRPGEQAIVGHTITEKGRKLLRGEDV